MLGGLNLKQLESFYWVARLGSFSHAARRLNTTQPGVSSRVRQLETRLGSLVFDRARHGAHLTPNGRELLSLVERLLAIDREWVERLGIAAKLAGLVRVGAADTMAMTLLPPLLARIGADHPDIDVELVVDLSVHLHARLREGEIDVAFMVGPIGSPDYESKRLGQVRNAWMCAPSLKLPRRRLTAADLAAQSVFTHSRGSHHHRMVMKWFDGAGVHPARLHGCSSLAMMIKLTEVGLGISVLPVPLLKQELEQGRLRCLPVELEVPSNTFVVAYPSSPAQPAARALAELALRTARSLEVFDRKGEGPRRRVASRASPSP